MTLDSQSTTSPSCSVGMRRLGFSAKYSAVLRPPYSRPTSIRSCGSRSSPIAHMTFCTLLDVLRPQIFSIRSSPARGRGSDGRGRCGCAERHVAEAQLLAVGVDLCTATVAEATEEHLVGQHLGDPLLDQARHGAGAEGF